MNKENRKAHCLASGIGQECLDYGPKFNLLPIVFLVLRVTPGLSRFILTYGGKKIQTHKKHLICTFSVATRILLHILMMVLGLR